MKDDAIAQVRNVTGVSQSDAVKLLEKYNYRVDVAVDAFFDGEFTVSETDHASSAEQAQALFDKYKDDDEDEIGVDGTINFLKDLDLELEEPVVLALAYEFKAPEVGRWSKAGWVDGMRGLGCGTMNDLKGAVNTMKQKLGSDHDYFRTVYTFTFSFGLSEGQRSLPVESAIGFWSVLLPFGIEQGVLGRQGPAAWQDQHTTLWFDYLRSQNTKGISKDTWGMFLDFIGSIDHDFGNFDDEGYWPSLIDDFVSYAKGRITKT